MPGTGSRQEVPVRLAGSMTLFPRGTEDPERVAFVQLDAGRRPDVADLARVILVEGIQAVGQPEFRYRIDPDHPGLLAAVHIQDPVDCRFTFRLSWADYPDFFETAAERGFFYLTAGEIEAVLSNRIRLSISASELRRAMDHWDESS